MKAVDSVITIQKDIFDDNHKKIYQYISYDDSHYQSTTLITIGNRNHGEKIEIDILIEMDNNNPEKAIDQIIAYSLLQ